MSADAMLAAARLLWPDPATVTIRRRGDVSSPESPGARRQEFVLVPSAADPKLVVPARPSAAAATVARSHSAPGSLGAAVQTAAIGYGFGSGVGARLLRDRLVVDSPAGACGLDEHLGGLLGRPVLVGMRVGPPRANRKPVLQIVTPRGELVAYAKLGVNALTDSLVAAEGAALARLAEVELTDVRVPALLHAGTWQGHQLLVQAALPVRRSRRRDAAARITAAMVTVARAEGSDLLPQRALPWWDRTVDAVSRIAEGSETGIPGRLVAVGEALAADADRVLPSGGWHGDWNPGNCAVLGDAAGTVLVWDWERYETGVPLGFDALHLHLQSQLGAGVDPLAAAGGLLAGAAPLLAPFDVPPAQASAVAALYLWGLGVRYAADDQAGAGAAVGRLERWLLPVLEQACGIGSGLVPVEKES